MVALFNARRRGCECQCIKAVEMKYTYRRVRVRSMQTGERGNDAITSSRLFDFGASAITDH